MTIVTLPPTGKIYRVPAPHVFAEDYFAGAQRVAVCECYSQGFGDDKVSYLLSDHLGSTSVTANVDGTLRSRTLYSASPLSGGLRTGEVRHQAGALPTNYREAYTGQYSNAADFGLMYYRARWYDPSLGRFSQADTIVPGAGNPMAWDRYAYVRNSPTGAVDPSGHLSCDSKYVADEDCSDMTTQTILETYYGVTLTGNWTTEDISAIYEGIRTIGSALVAVVDGVNTGAEMFKKVFKSLSLELLRGAKDGEWYCTGSGSGFSCDPDSAGKISARLVAHELGHTLNAIIANNKETTPYDDLWNASILNDFGNWVTGRKNSGIWERGYAGYKSRGTPDLYHGPDDWSDSATGTRNEEFADMFLNWAFNSFDYRREANGAGTARYNWMTTNMTEWVSRASR